MHVVIVGGSGFVGTRVLDSLKESGATVTALVRSQSSLERLSKLHPGVRTLRVDVTDANAVRNSLGGGIDALVYLPGLLREDKSTGQTFQRVHVDGVQQLLREASRVGISRWIQMSALGVSPNSTIPYFKTKWVAEELVRESGLAWTILRPSVIFDDRPRAESNFVTEIERLVRRSPIIPIPGSGEFKMQPVSLDDVAATITQALQMDSTVGKTYEMGGPEILTHREIVGVIANTLGLHRRFVPMPMGLVRTIVAVMGRYKNFPVSSDQLAMLVQDNFVRNSAALEEWLQTFSLPMKRFRPSVQLALSDSR